MACFDRLLFTFLLCSTEFILGNSQEITSRLFDTTQDVTLKATPTSVYDGFTKDVTVNCSFERQMNSDFSTLQALILSKSDSSGPNKYRELAILTSKSNGVEEVESLGAEVTGAMAPNQQTFIAFKWTWPDQEVAGTFYCEAHGWNGDHHPRMSTASVEVIIKETLDEGVLPQKMQELESRLHNCSTHSKSQEETIELLHASEKKVEGELSKARTQSKSQAETIEKLHDSEKKLQEELMDASKYMTTGLKTVTWQNHTYFLSRPLFISILSARDICQSLGGDLIEIDSEDEYLFAKELIEMLKKENTDTFGIMINGWDEGHEGNWTFMGSEKPMPVLHWSVGNPDNAGGENCMQLYMTAPKTPNFNDYLCYYAGRKLNILCEFSQM